MNIDEKEVADLVVALKATLAKLNMLLDRILGTQPAPTNQSGQNT